jgi:hypothetical protein
MRCIALVVLVSACYGGIDQSSASTGAPDPGAAPPDAAVAIDGHMMDEVDQQMIDTASQVRRFTKIDRAAYPSTLGAFNLDSYVNDDVRDYKSVHPETPGTGITMPVGTVIIREVLDSTTGAITKITLMGKGPAGYDSTLGDWWFGVTDPSGVPLPDGNGGVQVGRLTDCHGCHVPRATDDYLFGVPKADQ